MYLDLNGLKIVFQIVPQGNSDAVSFQFHFSLWVQTSVTLVFKTGIMLFLIYMRKILAFVTIIESSVLSMTRKWKISVEFWPLIRLALSTLVFLRWIILFLPTAHEKDSCWYFAVNSITFHLWKWWQDFLLLRKVPNH